MNMKQLIIVILSILVIPANLFCQKNKANFPKIDLPEYYFINYSHNKIQIPGDSSQIKFFYRKLDKLLRKGEGQINIIHIGGSHVQADMFPHKVRKNLDLVNSRFQTPRGFIFPFSVAKTNNPSNYKVSYSGQWKSVKNIQRNRNISVGVGGISVYTNDPAANINVALNPGDLSNRWNFNRLRLLGYADGGNDAVKPVLYYNNSAVEAKFDKTDNSYLFELPELAESFNISFVQKEKVPHTFVVDGFIAEKETPGIVYHSIGVNGASVSSYLNCEFFEKELAFIIPDMVIFEIGINDAVGKNFSKNNFISNYDLLTRMFERVNPNCAFIFITNNDSYCKSGRKGYEVNPNGVTAKEAFFTIATGKKGAVWDLFSIMGGLNSMKTWHANGLARADKIHFTKSGYELLGDLLYNALVDFYLQNNIE
jgi:lysophospholipase L1-like esterase